MFLLRTRAIGACLLLIVSAIFSVHAEPSAVPLDLQQAVSAALRGNPALQTFAFQFRAGDARTRQAGLRPALDASIELENFAGSGETRGFDVVEATFALSQVIELGGKRDARIGAAQAGRSALDIERQVIQLDVLAEVTRRFIAVAQRQQQVQLALKSVALAEETVAASERRVNSAKSPHAELDRARIARDRFRLEERAAHLELDSARKQLAATWGESQPVIGGQPFGEVRADLFTLPPTGDFAELAARLGTNPNFLRFASEARLRDAEMRLASTRRRPDFTLGAGVRHLESTNDQAFVTSFSMPLSFGHRAESFVTEAQANRERVDAERRIAEVKAQATLYELHRQLTRAVLEARTLKDDIQPRSAEALRETEYAYGRGRYGYLELVDAQREYLSVQASLIDAAASAHILRAEIERLTGAPITAPDFSNPIDRPVGESPTLTPIP
jgi:cobalt-zinc-cadmium efflux system outer membrane protein